MDEEDLRDAERYDALLRYAEEMAPAFRNMTEDREWFRVRLQRVDDLTQELLKRARGY